MPLTTELSYKAGAPTDCCLCRVLTQALQFAARANPHVIDGSAARRICLADAMKGATVWSEHYDLQVAEVFAVQDAIAERIAAAIEPELLLRHGLQVAPHTGNVTAWDLVRQGTFNFSRGNAANSPSRAAVLPTGRRARSHASRGADLAGAGQRRPHRL